MRGKDIIEKEEILCRGITPAYAGKSKILCHFKTSH